MSDAEMHDTTGAKRITFIKPVYYTESGALKKLTISSKPPAPQSRLRLWT